MDICRLAAEVAALQIAHWGADTVTNEHRALGDLYDTMQELVDDFVEAFAGKTGILPKTGRVVEVTVELDNAKLLSRGLALIEETRSALPASANEDLLNILADMEAAYSKAKYLLKVETEHDTKAAEAAEKQVLGYARPKKKPTTVPARDLED